MIIAVSGIRDLHPESHATVRAEMRRLVEDPAVTEIRFGGAEGVDTVAIETAHVYADRIGRLLLLTVIVPFTVQYMRHDAHVAAHAHAGRVIELGLPRYIEGRFNNGAYHVRNAALLDGPPDDPTAADLLVAFSDGRESGGTYQTMAAAHARDIQIKPVLVRSTKEPR